MADEVKKKKNKKPKIAIIGTNIVLGEIYRDKYSDIEGRATAVTFFEAACERVQLEWYENDRLVGSGLKTETFDAVRLIHVGTGEDVELVEDKSKAAKTGGPDRPSPGRQTTPTRS